MHSSVGLTFLDLSDHIGRPTRRAGSPRVPRYSSGSASFRCMAAFTLSGVILAASS